MSSIRETAEQFFDACETGKGWDGCQTYCHDGATFSSQAGALEGVETVQGYTDWMKGLFTPVPDASYEVRSFAVDDARQNVAAYGVFRGTQPARAGRCRRRERRSRPTTSTSWISTAIESVT